MGDIILFIKKINSLKTWATTSISDGPNIESTHLVYPMYLEWTGIFQQMLELIMV